MSTLDELMLLRPPGTKVCHRAWDPGRYFECWFYAENSWHGKLRSGLHDCFSGDAGTDWVLWPESRCGLLDSKKCICGKSGPKSKKRLYLWAIRDPSNPFFYVLDQAYREMPPNQDAVRIESSMIEVDDG